MMTTSTCTVIFIFIFIVTVIVIVVAHFRVISPTLFIQNEVSGEARGHDYDERPILLCILLLLEPISTTGREQFN